MFGAHCYSYSLCDLKALLAHLFSHNAGMKLLRVKASLFKNMLLVPLVEVVELPPAGKSFFTLLV